MKLLIANRGEVAIRIARAAADLGIPTVAVFSEDDSRSRHIQLADEAIALQGAGARAYLDIEGLIAAAKNAGCTATHPGYGFVSENADFASAAEAAGIAFVGPTPDTLTLFGDKVRARALAQEHGVPVVTGISEPVDVASAKDFFANLPGGALMLFKAVGGGGGRGMRVVETADQIEDAFKRAQSEAQAAFGNPEVYVEQLVPAARHIEVQIVGDGAGTVKHLGTRDCSLQRRHQKIVEIAPAPNLSSDITAALADASIRLAKTANYRSLGTFEFLVVGDEFYFIEANARLQVEHTVTEEVMGVDLVAVQLQLAASGSLPTLPEPTPSGFAIQARVNMETMLADGGTKPSGGTLAAFDPPTGPAVRTDTFGYTGYSTSPNFDSLLAKVIVRAPTFESAINRTKRSLRDFRIEGIRTNLTFLQAILDDPNVTSMNVHTRYVDQSMANLVEAAELFDSSGSQAGEMGARAGVKLGTNDPLAVLDHGKSGAFATQQETETAVVADTTPVPPGTIAVRAPMQGTIISIEVAEDEEVVAGRTLFIMEAMKMEHVITTEVNGSVHSLNVAVGDAVYEGHSLAFVEEREVAATSDTGETKIDLDDIRPDVAEVHARHEITLDAARPDAVAKRRKTNQRTARENINDLCDPGTFVEHGQLVLTPGTGLPREEVIRKFSTDGMVTGVGGVNGDLFGPERSRAVVMSYDYTVLAGTQGAINHPKTDRMLQLCEKWRIPMVLFAEGGGGRAGTGGKREGGKATTNAAQGRDDAAYRPLDTPTFAQIGRLSGLVPMIGITSRFCFAGNASLLGCCDVIIATADANIGMGGPALIEGGGLGVFRPEEIGPLDVQTASGVVDVAVQDEQEAVAVAKQYLSYFQGRVHQWDCPDQRQLRNIIPENRLRVYNVRDVINTMADTGSALELRKDFGHGIVTSLIRIEGRPIGVIANNPLHLSGAIDSPGSDKAARFMQICDAFDIPVLVLCDTPGMMVGPEIEKTGLVRHCSRLFVTGANLTVPLVTIVLRKAYGLGAQAMAGGSMKEPFATVAWPTGEFGGMGLEGQVKLGFRNELAAMEDPDERVERYNQLVDAAYERGRALNAGVSFAVDDVIDPADSRHWVSRILDSIPDPIPTKEKKRRNIDTW